MRRGMVIARYGVIILLALLLLPSCRKAGGDEQVVEIVINRYNQLLIEGYRTLNMNPMQEVTTKEQAEKLYYHMAALGEARIRMESNLKKIKFEKLDFRNPDDVLVETQEIWDFTQYRIDTGVKYYEERDFIYEMAYRLSRTGNRWIITNVSTISGKSTNTTIPKRDHKSLMGAPSMGGKPVGHP